MHVALNRHRLWNTGPVNPSLILFDHDALHDQLSWALKNHLDEYPGPQSVYIISSYIRKEGMDVMWPIFQTLEKQGTTMRIISTFNRKITDIDSVERLAKLKQTEVYSFQPSRVNFHAKSWVFTDEDRDIDTLIVGFPISPARECQMRSNGTCFFSGNSIEMPVGPLMSPTAPSFGILNQVSNTPCSGGTWSMRTTEVIKRGTAIPDHRPRIDATCEA